MQTTWIERFISDYGKENGYIDYKALADAIKWDTGGLILNNTLGYRVLQDDFEVNSGNFNVYYNSNGEDITYEEYEESDNAYEDIVDIFQFYIVDSRGAHILEDFNELVIYSEEYDIYLWCITHYGTGWDYVLTDVKIGESN